ncbi:TetR/AcrR family transcriptional regulator [Paraburkholderia sp. C35]|uniref:TetR/AcrR family transcriptional regulator n=1 Tax=Paraburkholderia sp. C35 TaxID=2126993 RepID=UPI000D6887DB|nr:TetR/AcrR family transcriptional regulator [Paraburkholderia sp. C35]
MARPRSEERRDAILAAATRVIASQGLGAPTAAIAKEAGTSNGSLFTYFATKADLLNALYLELKGELGSVALAGVPVDSDIRTQMLQLWRNWLHWAMSSPEKRKALQLLSVSKDLTSQTRETGLQLTAGMAAYIERCRMNGPMRNEPLMFVGALINSMAEAAIEYIMTDPANAESRSLAAFEAVWRAVT